MRSPIGLNEPKILCHSNIVYYTYIANPCSHIPKLPNPFETVKAVLESPGPVKYFLVHKSKF